MCRFLNTIKWRFLRLTIIAMALWMAGCSSANRAVEVCKLDSANQIVEYENGRLVVERSIVDGSDQQRNIDSWLRSHADGWRADFVNYVPVRMIRGKRFTLNFHPALCILNYQTSDGVWKQVSRLVPPADPMPDLFGDSR
jgi:hypothetical protein